MSSRTETAVRRVLVTGANGRIGAYFAEQASQKYALRLMVQHPGDGARALEAYGEVVVADLGDLARLKEVCAGMDAVLHLAGNADPSATWRELLDANIAGTYHLMTAAKSAGCRRVVYASSMHAVSGFPPDVQVKTGEPVNPVDLYGVTKCFGEALGRYMAEQEGLSVIAVRIGTFAPLDVARMQRGLENLDTFVSRRDLQLLLERAIEVPELRFAVVHGLSDNRFKRLDLTDTRALLGYAPQDDVTREHPALRGLHRPRPALAHNVNDPAQALGLREDL